MVHEIWSTIDRIVLILNHFLPFYPSMDQESQNFEKMKRTPWDIIILHMCTINDNHDVWFLRYGAQRTEYLPFWIIFCHFTLPHHLPPTNNPENQNFEKVKKKLLQTLSFYTCVPQMTIIWCMVPEIWSTTEKVTYWGGCPT